MAPSVINIVTEWKRTNTISQENNNQKLQEQRL